MSDIVCQVGNQSGQVEFIWSSRGGYFEPYVISGTQWTSLRKAVDQTRVALEALVFELNSAGTGQPPWEPSFGLAEAGYRLHQELLPVKDRTVGDVRDWLKQLRKQPGLIGLEVVVEERAAESRDFLAVPWNLVYDEMPSKAAFEKGQSTERWRPFWAVRYNLSSGRRVDPLKRLPVWSDPRVILVIDPTVRENLDEDQRRTLDRFTSEPGLTTVGSWDGLRDAMREGYPRLLYWLGHTSEHFCLRLGDEEIAPADLKSLLNDFVDTRGPQGMVAFLNACQTAEAMSAGSFLHELHETYGFSGAIVTERQTIDNFANEFGLGFLEGFLKGGEPLGELLHGLRLKYAPLGLLYGAHCPPEIRIRYGDGVADVATPPTIREGGPVAGTPLGETATRGRRKQKRHRRSTRALAVPQPVPVGLPEQPYRSLAFYDEKDRALFTGRDADIVRFAATLDRPDTRILILHGESGTGKSSFLRAGVIPYLEEECVGYRFFRRPDGKLLFVQAAKDLVGGLTQALLDATATSLSFRTPDGEERRVNLRRVLDEALGAPADHATLREALLGDPHLLAAFLARMADRLPHALVLVVDQGEEVFTLARSDDEVASRDLGLRMLQRVVDVKADVKLIVSLRTEYYGRLLDHLRAGRRDLTGVRDDLLRDFSRSALVEAIKRPTSDAPPAPSQPSPREKYGFRYAEGIPELIADGVMALRSENQDGVLPLVQVICTQLYQRERTQPGMDGIITREDLDAIKGVGGGLKAFAEDALARSMRLVASDRIAFKRIFIHLYNRQPDGTLTTWMMPRASLEGRWRRHSPFANVLEAAKLARLLREDELRVEGGEPRRYIRLGHDALAKVAADWDEELSRAARLRRYIVQAALVAAFILMPIVVIFASIAWMQASIARDTEIRGRQYLYDSQISMAQLALDGNRVDRANALLEQQKPTARHHDESDLRGFDWYYLWKLGHSGLHAMIGHTEDIGSVAFSPDGVTIASASEDGTIRLWRAEDGRTESILEGGSGKLTSVAFSPDGRTIAAGSEFGNLLFDFSTRTRIHSQQHQPNENLSRLSPSPSSHGRFLRSGEHSDVARIRLITRASMAPAAGYQTVPVAFSPNGKLLASGLDRRIEIVETATKKIRFQLTGHNERITTLVFSPDGQTLASGGWDKTLRLWRLGEGKKQPIIDKIIRFSDWITSVAFSPDGKMVACGSWDRTVRLVTASEGSTIATLTGHTAFTSSVAFSPDGKTIASGGGDMTIRLWDVKTKMLQGILSGHTDTVNSVAFSPDGKTLASSARDRTVRSWDVAKGRQWILLESSEFATTTAFSPDGKTIATGAASGLVRLWDATTGVERRSLPGELGELPVLAFTPDNALLACARQDQSVSLRDATTGEVRKVFSGHPGQVGSLDFSSDGRLLAGMTLEGCDGYAAMGNPYWSIFPQNCDHLSVV